MNPEREWTPFALEAEESAFGMNRIAKWHNETVSALRRLQEQTCETCSWARTHYVGGKVCPGGWPTSQIRDVSKARTPSR